MSDKEKWLDGELWNFVRGAAIDLEIPLKSPAEEQLYWHMRQACGVYANVLAAECTAPAPQPADDTQWIKPKFPATTPEEWREFGKTHFHAATPQVTRLQGLEEAAQMCDRWHEIYKDETAQRLADVIRKAIRRGTSEQASPTPDKECLNCSAGSCSGKHYYGE